MSRGRRPTLPLVPAFLLLFPAVLAAQSADEVLQQALQRYEQRMAGVRDYTVVQTVLGFDATTYFERDTVDGQVVFVQKDGGAGEVAGQVPQDYGAILEAMGERATHQGKDTVDGTECHVLALDDFSGEGMEAFAPPESGGDWSPERLRLWIESDRLVPRKMRMEGTMRSDGEPKPVTFTAWMRDYREVQGVLHPFRMEVSTEGIDQALSEKEQAELRSSIRQMRAQMEEMPPKQREMVERMMGGEIAKLEKMLRTGAMDVTVRVEDLRVNQGPPGKGN